MARGRRVAPAILRWPAFACRLQPFGWIRSLSPAHNLLSPPVLPDTRSEGLGSPSICELGARNSSSSSASSSPSRWRSPTRLSGLPDGGGPATAQATSASCPGLRSWPSSSWSTSRASGSELEVRAAAVAERGAPVAGARARTRAPRHVLAGADAVARHRRHSRRCRSTPARDHRQSRRLGRDRRRAATGRACSARRPCAPQAARPNITDLALERSRCRGIAETPDGIEYEGQLCFPMIAAGATLGALGMPAADASMDGGSGARWWARQRHSSACRCAAPTC